VSGFIVKIKQGQNFPDLAQEHYGDWTRYQEIVDANPGYAGRPPHTDSRWSPPVVAPTLYVGDEVLIRPDPNPSEEPEETTPVPEQKKTIKKRTWTGTEKQTPTPRIEIFLPSTASSFSEGNKPDLVFEPDKDADVWAKLLSYSFTEAVDDIEGSFSFSTETGEDTERKKNIYDLIPIRSVIRIFEGGKAATFTGIIRRRKFSKQMTSQGIKKSVVFSGKSITSCVSEYMVSLDVRIYKVADQVSKNIDINVQLSEAETIADFLRITWNHFNDVSLGMNKDLNGVTNTEISEVIKRFMGEGTDDFVIVDGQEKDIRYNVAAIFYNAANNNIADVWRNILPQLAYEIFSRCEDGKPKIVIRQTPFGDPKNDYADWNNLDIYEISPISLTAYELEQSDDTVYTAFAAYVIGSSMDRNFYMAVNQEGADDRVRYNSEKVKIYGFRPLEIDFMGYDRRGNTENNDIKPLTEAVKQLNELAAYWYSRTDDMYSGSITICTDFRQPDTNPRVGCRVKFLGGEFYINKADHSWVYGGTPTIKLTVSRGMLYDESGKMRDGANGIITGIAEKYKEIEIKAAVPG